MARPLDLRNPSIINGVKASPTSAPQPCAMQPPEVWLQNEREQKKERRKQSNRESARRSRLRKQAETEELARKVASLTAENMALKSDMSQLTGKAEKLRLENAALLEKLKNAQLARTEEIVMNDDNDEHRTLNASTENLLSRVNNSASVDSGIEEDGGLYDRNSNSGAKLHQLLDTSPRADAVAAG